MRRWSTLITTGSSDPQWDLARRQTSSSKYEQRHIFMLNTDSFKPKHVYNVLLMMGRRFLFLLQVVIDKHPVRFFVHKRPHVDFFLEVVSVSVKRTVNVLVSCLLCFSSHYIVLQSLTTGCHKTIWFIYWTAEHWLLTAYCVLCVCAQVSQWYELVVFTASMEIYGSAVADKLDNNRNILRRRYYRQVLL